MRAKRKNGLVAVVIVLVLLVLAFLFAPRLEKRETPDASRAATATTKEEALPERTLGAQSVFDGVDCRDDDALCAIQNVKGGINVAPSASRCRVLYMEKYTGGVALFTDASRTKRLQPIVGKTSIGEVSVAASSGGVKPPAFVFTRVGPPNAENAFHVGVSGKFVRFGERGVAELASAPSPIRITKASGTEAAILMLGASVVDGVLTRNDAPTVYVKLYFEVSVGESENVCVSGDIDRLTLRGLNRNEFARQADASTSYAVDTCIFVADWARKPTACNSLCERAFPNGDPMWCEWAARVDPTVASGAETAGVCCTTLKHVHEAASAAKGCSIGQGELWVKVPYASGAFAATGDASVEIPAYATIALRLSQNDQFSAVCA